MNIFNNFPHLKSVLIGLSLLMVIGFANSGRAQPVLSARNMALGGGGTAYLGGVEATFWNPANIMLNDRHGTFHLGLGSAALQFEPMLSSRSVTNQFSAFTNYYLPYQQGEQSIGPEQLNHIVQTHFPGNELQAQNLQRADVMLAGALWQRRDHAISIALRARYGSNIQTGRGWYDTQYYNHGGQLLRNFTLNQHRSELYELSVGYAQEFTFINGLMPRLSKLYIGIAPKLVLAGPTFNATYKARYIKERASDINSMFVSSFELHSSGGFSRVVEDYLRNGHPRQAIERHLREGYHFRQTGVGIGFDFGLNYVIPLEGSPAPSDTGLPPAGKTLRIAFSLNDIGSIRYSGQPLNMSSTRDSIQTSMTDIPANTVFTGAGGQYISFLDATSFLPNPLQRAENRSRQSHLTLLPTSVNTGILLDLANIKFMGDLTFGLNNTAFTTQNLTVHLGTEIRPIQQIPIRIGTRLASELPLQVGLGTGLETKYWDFSIGALASFHSQSAKTTLVGGAFGGLQLHF